MVKVLARDWSLEIETTKDTYKEVKGITSLTFASEKNDADTTTFDNDGWTEHLVASRTKTLTIEGFYLEDPSDGTRDEGQKAVDLLSEKMGHDSLGKFKLTSPGGTVRTFSASAAVTSIGGGNDDPTGWSCELTVSGQVTTA
jgi:predicted secreted protein